MANPILYDIINNEIKVLLANIKDDSGLTMLNNVQLQIPTPNIFAQENYLNNKGTADIWFLDGTMNADTLQIPKESTGTIMIFSYFYQAIDSNSDAVSILPRLMSYIDKVIQSVNMYYYNGFSNYKQFYCRVVDFSTTNVLKRLGFADFDIAPPYYGVAITLNFKFKSTSL